MNVTNHPLVESYWVEELPNGLIHLCINVKEKGVYCHQYNDEMYLILPDENDLENVKNADILEIPKFLKEDKSIIYISTKQVEKDQISYYFIPYKKEWVKNRKFIIE